MAIDFRYVPVSGDLPGASFEKQTERAFNELGANIDGAIDSANEAKEIAQNAQDTANNALQTAQSAVTTAQEANETADNALAVATAAQTAADNAQDTANQARQAAAIAQTTADTAQTTANAAQTTANTAQSAANDAQLRADEAYSLAESSLAVANEANDIYIVTETQIDLDSLDCTAAQKLYLTSQSIVNLPPGLPQTDAPFFFKVLQDDAVQNIVQTIFSQREPGLQYIRSGVRDVDENNIVVVDWAYWTAAGGGVVLQLTGAFLSRSIGGTTDIAKSLFPAGTSFVENQTLIFDDNGALGVYRGDVNATTITVQTKTISPVGDREPVLLGNVDTHADLPATVTAATAVFGRTPVIDDYARVLVDETHNGNLVEWYVTALDTAADTLAWGNPLVINTSDYQAQTTAADAGRVPVAGGTPGAWGQSRAIEDAAPTVGSNALITSGAVANAISRTGGIPSGGIIMWSGAIANIPEGWALCDGQNSTPDLRDRFIIGAGDAYAVGATGGAASVTPAGTVSNTVAGGTVANTTITTATMPAHGHTLSYAAGNSNTGGSFWGAEYFGSTSPIPVANSNGSNGSHAHGFVGNVHDHAFTGTSQENCPPYYALAYIMKI